MASFDYLWQHRARFRFGSPAFFRAWAKRGLSFPEVLNRNRLRNRLSARGATISATAELSDPSIQGKPHNLSVGEFSFVGRAHLALHAGIQIGKHVCINDGVKLLTASHDVQDPHWTQFAKAIIIEDFAWIAMDAIILPGVRIGRGAVVGAGAVVRSSVEEGQIVYGNPARPSSKLRCQNLDYNPCEFLAANRAWLHG